MAGYEFKIINEGPDAGRYLFYIGGVLQDGTYTLEECLLKISEDDDYPDPLENPAENPCKPACPMRSAHCHGACPAYKAYRKYRDAKCEERLMDTPAKDFASRSIEKHMKMRKKTGKCGKFIHIK